LSIFISRKSIF